MLEAARNARLSAGFWKLARILHTTSFADVDGA
jgi:hypothetical protein